MNYLVEDPRFDSHWSLKDYRFMYLTFILIEVEGAQQVVLPWYDHSLYTGQRKYILWLWAMCKIRQYMLNQEKPEMDDFEGKKSLILQEKYFNILKIFFWKIHKFLTDTLAKM